MALPGFIKRTGDALSFYGEGEFIFYVPESFFDSKNAIIIGDYVDILGVLNYTIQDKNGKNGGLKTFNFPSRFITRPGSIEKAKELKLTKYSDVQDYRLFRYKKDDLIVVSTKTAEDIANVESLFQMFLITGNIPNTIPYDEIQNYYTNSIKLNGSNFGVTLQEFGFIISETCRDPKDESKPFRLSGEKDMCNYKPISIKTVPKLIGPFSSVTSENWDEAVVNAITNKSTKSTPMEKILMT